MTEIVVDIRWLLAIPPTLIFSVLIAYRLGIFHAERTFRAYYGCLYCGKYMMLEPIKCTDIHCQGNPEYDEYAESQLRHSRGRIRRLTNRIVSRCQFN